MLVQLTFFINFPRLCQRISARIKGWIRVGVLVRIRMRVRSRVTVMIKFRMKFEIKITYVSDRDMKLKTHTSGLSCGEIVSIKRQGSHFTPVEIP